MVRHRPTTGAQPGPLEVRSVLAQFGAPLNASQAESTVSLEEALVAALEHAHHDSTLFKVLPVVLLRNMRRLDFDMVTQSASQRDRLVEWGMLLDLTGEIAGEESLSRRARALLETVRPVDRGCFFGGRTQGERFLAEKRTPPAVRRWGYRMNLTETSLRAFAEKFS